MPVFESEMRFALLVVKSEYPARIGLSHPTARFAPTKLVKLCYTLVHAAEAVGIRDLADGEFQPTDTTLEEGIERQVDTIRWTVCWKRVPDPISRCKRKWTDPWAIK